MTYARQIATAKKLIEAKGGACTYIVNTVGAPIDVNKPWRGTDNTSKQHTNIRMAFIPAKPSRSEQDRVPRGQNTVYLAAASLPSVTPKENDSIVRPADSTHWRVTTVDTLNVNGEAIIHTLLVVAA